VFPASFEALSKFCIFCCWLLLVINVSDRPLCFSAKTDQVIVASDRPWCFAARTNQLVVQVSDQFFWRKPINWFQVSTVSAGIAVLFNYLVICFESLYCVL
jgi:hypothetical protein